MRLGMGVPDRSGSTCPSTSSPRPSTRKRSTASIPRPTRPTALEGCASPMRFVRSSDRLATARRPVLLAGTGVRLAGALDAFEAAVERLGIPVTTAWTHDLIASDDPHFCGRQGTIGTRAGNFTVQNADLLLIVGTRLTVRQVGYNWQAFAPEAFKVVVDIDEAEFRRPFVQIDLPIHADAGRFLTELIGALDASTIGPSGTRTGSPGVASSSTRYPPVRDDQRTTAPPINPYHFIERLFEAMAQDDVVACGDATATIVPFQTARIKRGQRVFSNSGSASMGYDLPAAVGAAVARRGRRVICLAGDGSLQMNIQELATVRAPSASREAVRPRQRRVCVDPHDAGQLLRRDDRLGSRRRDFVPRLSARSPRPTGSRPCASSSRALWTTPSPGSSRPTGRSSATCSSIRSRVSSRASSPG